MRAWEIRQQIISDVTKKDKCQWQKQEKFCTLLLAN